MSSLFKKSYKALLTSYRVSLLFVKKVKPHNTVQELILPVNKEILDTVMRPSTNKILQLMLLSDTTISRRIDEMASNVELKLCNTLINVQFILQLDEATGDSESLLLA